MCLGAALVLWCDMEVITRCRMLCMLSFIFIFMKWMHSRNKMQRNCGTSYVHGDVYAIRIIGEFLLFSLCNVNERMNATWKPAKEKHT